MKNICPECNIAYKKSLRANICDDCNKDEVLELQMVLFNKENNKSLSVKGPDIWESSNRMLDMYFPNGLYGKEEEPNLELEEHCKSLMDSDLNKARR